METEKITVGIEPEEIHEEENPNNNENLQMEQGSIPLSLIRMDPELQRSRRRRWSIIKVPSYITDINSDAYMPRVVSIGPRHYGKQHLMPMEERKRKCAFVFMDISRFNRQRCYDRFRAVMPQLMEHYEPLHVAWPRNEFIERMVVDGCFLLHCFFYRSRAYGDRLDDDLRDIMGSKICRDLLLIENQLPMQVLLILLRCAELEAVEQEIQDDSILNQSLNKLILDFFNCGHITVGDSCLHVLDVYRKSMLGKIASPTPNSPSHHFSAMDLDVWWLRGPKFPTATVLSHTGVKFKENEVDDLMDINFDKHSLSLPGLFVDQDTESLFLNLMALERFSEVMSHPISSYVDFMGVLIRSTQDVKLLRSHGIIQSEESDDVVANLFNKLAKNPAIDPDGSLFKVRCELARSSEGYIRKCNERLADWESNFVKTYCKNIWTAIGLLAGAIILVATVTQAVFAVLQYYQKDRLPTARNP